MEIAEFVVEIEDDETTENVPVPSVETVIPVVPVMLREVFVEMLPLEPELVCNTTEFPESEPPTSEMKPLAVNVKAPLVAVRLPMAWIFADVPVVVIDKLPPAEEVLA